jgi:glycosyltransferase involved in cell wall biosynthesis
LSTSLIVYDYFYPAYQAGGPVQSLTNLAAALNNEQNAAVVCGAVDLQEKGNLPGITIDSWESVNFPASNAHLKVWYASKLNKGMFKKCLQDSSCSTVYLNGMFSYRFVIIPLLAIDKSKTKVVLCPRGMLQSGALAGKSFKKKIYLTLLKLSGLVKNITWHATNAEEEEDIKKVFGKGVEVMVAANIPKAPVSNVVRTEKVPGQLRLIYLSLIAEKKNLLQVIELVNNSAANISLDIYGPVKDAAYWKKCEQAVAGTNGKVNYKGDIRPELVQDTFVKYDASILLTKGENFGHALYESLSTGRPVITSYFTPWNELEQKRAGWNLDISDNDACLQKMESICKMDNDAFYAYCKGAYAVAQKYYAEASDMTNYHKLFSS